MLTSLEPFISVHKEVNVQKGRKKKEKQDSSSVALNMQYLLLALKYYKTIPITLHIKTYKKICLSSGRNTCYTLSSKCLNLIFSEHYTARTSLELC